MNLLARYIIYFMVYSFIGWLIEVSLVFIGEKKFVNRGFLLGPICPIYGFGFIFIILTIGSNTKDLLAVFLKSILICSTLEYFTSLVMEKIFKARWWDYSDKKFNINGRICLEYMLPFGILGTIGLCYIHPFIISLVKLLSSKLTIIIAIILFVLFLIDNIISFKVMSKIKTQIKKEKGDNTVAVKNKVTDWLKNNTIWYRHIINAFPKFEIISKVKKITEVIKVKPKNKDVK